MHDAGIKFVVETARPVSTGYSFVQELPVDAVAYLNGALLDFNPSASDYDMLTSPELPDDGHLRKIGFSSKRACEVCKYLLDKLPDMEVGIVMDDVRYTNFDVTKYWKTQTWRYKERALGIFADHMSTSLNETVSFGDDLVDIAMLRESGRGVAVANANPDVLKIADDICPANNDDGVAQWIESNLL